MNNAKRENPFTIFVISFSISVNGIHQLLPNNPALFTFVIPFPISGNGNQQLLPNNPPPFDFCDFFFDRPKWKSAVSSQ